MRLAAMVVLLILTSHAMGYYDIHITKRTEWSDKSGPAITLEDWKKLLAADSEMRLDGAAEAVTPDGKKLRVENEGLAVWIKWSKHGRNDNMAWFYYFEGDVTVKNPDKEIFGKMFRIAEKLGARLQGDEGEFYNARGEVLK